MILAIKNEQEDLAKLLINKSSSEDLNHQDKEGKTPLIHACIQGYHTLVDLLMQRKVETPRYDKYGKTALIYACKNGHLLCVDSLLSEVPKDKVAISWKDAYDMTARNYSQDHDIRQLLNQFMIENNKESDSFIKGIFITDIIRNI